MFKTVKPGKVSKNTFINLKLPLGLDLEFLFHPGVAENIAPVGGPGSH